MEKYEFIGDNRYIYIPVGFGIVIVILFIVASSMMIMEGDQTSFAWGALIFSCICLVLIIIGLYQAPKTITLMITQDEIIEKHDDRIVGRFNLVNIKWIENWDYRSDYYDSTRNWDRHLVIRGRWGGRWRGRR